MNAIHPPRKGRTVFHQGIHRTYGAWEAFPPEATGFSDEEIRDRMMQGLAATMAAGGLLRVATETEGLVALGAATITRVDIEIQPTLEVAGGGVL